MAEYETQVAFYQRYNYGATADMRKELVDQMNRILDDLYENRYDELYHQNAFREVKGKQITIPLDVLPKVFANHPMSELATNLWINNQIMAKQQQELTEKVKKQSRNKKDMLRSEPSSKSTKSTNDDDDMFTIGDMMNQYIS